MAPQILFFFSKKLNLQYNKINSLLLFLINNSKKKNIFKMYLTYGFLLHILEFLIYFLAIKLLGIPIGLKFIFVIFIINMILDSNPIVRNNLAVTELLGGVILTLVGGSFSEFVIIKVVVRIVNLSIIIPLFLLLNLFFKSEI